jgi:NAD(P)-dependent dehydrogenase (short-subunit alcohol dehydrogenase family)
VTTLITGGAGFVALNVAEALLRRGEDVVLLDRAAPPLAAECGSRPGFAVDEAFADFGAWLRRTPDALAAGPTGGTT